MDNTRRFKLIVQLLILVIVSAGFICLQPKHKLYVIGDSTVRNSNKETWGWGTFIGKAFDTSRLVTENQAIAGRSTRTFLKEGRWDKVLASLQPGDYVMMQFGHNDGSFPDTTRSGSRGALRGTGEETRQLQWKDGTIEVVHTYGWYLRKFVRETKAKGATPIVISMIPRNIFKDGKVERVSGSFGKWAAEVAAQEGAFFIDLNSLVADKYDAMGPEKVKEFFPGDHTHTNAKGAELNAATIIEGLRNLKDCSLNEFLVK